MHVGVYKEIGCLCHCTVKNGVFYLHPTVGVTEHLHPKRCL